VTPSRKLLNSELHRLPVEQFRQADKLPAVVVLDNVRSQHNVGAAFRTCDAFRVERLYLCGITPLPPHREIYKTALGAEESVAWESVAETVHLVRRLRQEGYTVIAIEQAEGSRSLADFAPAPDARHAFVLGNEVRGVDQQVVDLCDYCLEIPQFGTKHSLNVSVATGIVLWQALHPLFHRLL
jgi:tRNA G18 (ribose-2'-O)-methylase SpoU